MTTANPENAVTAPGANISTTTTSTALGREATGRITMPSIPLRIAAGASLIAGVLHYAAVPEHRTEWTWAAVFFTVLAAVQIIWAALVWCEDRRLVLIGGLLINAATVALWAVSRTSGLPFGPEAGEPETIGVLDVACTLAELIILIAVLLACRGRRRTG